MHGERRIARDRRKEIGARYWKLGDMNKIKRLKLRKGIGLLVV